MRAYPCMAPTGVTLGERTSSESSLSCSARSASSSESGESPASSGSAGRPRALGRVVFLCQDTGLEKRGQVLPNGFIWHHDEMYTGPLEWLSEAPLRPPLQREAGTEVTPAHVCEEKDEAMPQMDCLSSPRRRSRSVLMSRSPPKTTASGTLGSTKSQQDKSKHNKKKKKKTRRESALMLNTLDDDINERVRRVAARVAMRNSSSNNNEGERTGAASAAEERMRSREAADSAAARRLFGPLCAKICKWQGSADAVTADAVLRECGGAEKDVEEHSSREPVFVLEQPTGTPWRFVICASDADGTSEQGRLRQALEAAEGKLCATVVLPVPVCIEALLDVLVEAAARGAFWGIERLVVACDSEREMAALTQAIEARADALPAVSI